MKEKIISVMKSIGVLSLLGILYFAFSFYRDVQDLKENQVTEDTIRKIVNEEIVKANKALELELIKNYLLNR